MHADPRFDALCDALGYRFFDEALLKLALTHCSHCGMKDQNNQRLEFLGDAVLDFVVSERLYNDANVDEGHLTRMRAGVVCESSLAQAARTIGIATLLLLGKGEEATGGRDKPSILADMMEAVLGAVYLDGGLQSVRQCTMRVLDNAIQLALEDGGEQDHKTMLQQLCAARQLAIPLYKMLTIEGPPHAPRFTIGVYVSDAMIASAVGNTKKEAEQRAAKQAVLKLLSEAGIEP